MSATIHGIHHVTAIGGDPLVNLDFYTRVLGLRLVKRTVNFDDRTTWHLYFGDRLGHPGTVMTFFPHPLARPGRPGSGEVARTAFAVPAGTLPAWRERLRGDGLAVNESEEDGRQLLQLHDPHGTRLALIETIAPDSDAEPWAGGGVANDIAIRGFAGVRLDVRDPGPTAAFLKDMLGLTELGPEGDSRRFHASGGGGASGGGQTIEVVNSAAPPAQLGAGSVHHVAFRVPDDDAQASLQRRIADAGFHVTDVQDRQYFRSIYFREPGGVIFEIATDVPGFATDESEAELGRALKLPPWLEPRRAALEQALPPLTQEMPA